jgi:hypothetical protein
MGLADIPTSFGSSFFIRTFFPASIATGLYSITFYGVIKEYLPPINFENIILILIIISLLIGILLNVFEPYIYKFYEGIWGWPNFLKEFFYGRQIKKFNKLENEFESIRLRKEELKNPLDEIASNDEEKMKKLFLLDGKLSQLSAELRKYPYNPDHNNYSQRYPERPTDFGNVMGEYESYSEKQYGMHMMVFWQHLWFVLPKEIRDDLDLRSAKADFNVYVSFILLTFAFIGTTVFTFQSSNGYKFFSWNILLEALILTAISLLGWYVFYNLSILEHKTYGRYIKASFDLYRFDLAEKLDIKIGESSEAEKDSWRILRDYFLDYRVPEK